MLWGDRGPLSNIIPFIVYFVYLFPTIIMVNKDFQYNVTCDHASVPAKWHLIPSNGFSKVHERDRQHAYGRSRYGNIYRNRQNRFLQCRLKTYTERQTTYTDIISYIT